MWLLSRIFRGIALAVGPGVGGHQPPSECHRRPVCCGPMVTLRADPWSPDFGMGFEASTEETPVVIRARTSRRRVPPKSSLKEAAPPSIFSAARLALALGSDTLSVAVSFLRPVDRPRVQRLRLVPQSKVLRRRRA